MVKTVISWVEFTVTGGLVVFLGCSVLADNYVQQVLADAPLGYWRLGEKDKSEPLADATGHGLDGVYVDYDHDGLQLGYQGAIAGDADGATRFQGTPGFHCGDCGQGHLPVGGILDLGFVGGATLTLEAWFKLLPGPDATLAVSAFPRILHYHSSGGQFAFGVVGDDTNGYPDSRTFWAALGDGSPFGGIIKAGPCSAIWPGAQEDWYHFVATIQSTENATNIRLFVNGEELTDLEDSDPIAWQAVQATIGGRRQSNAEESPVQGFPGLLDEVVIYDTVLGEDRIRAHFQTGRPAPEARLEVLRAEGPGLLSVECDGLASTPPPGQRLMEWHWNFGDGATAEGGRATHAYKQAGNFSVSLRVTSNLGTSDYAGERITVEFPGGDVNPWLAADIGAPESPGGARRDGSCLVIFAGAGDLGGVEDSCHFVSTPREGDWTITTRLQDIFWQPTGRAGLMYRHDLSPNSVMAALSVTETHGPLRLSWITRSDRGAEVVSRQEDSPVEPPAAYLRLSRQGDVIIGSTSPDGENFLEFQRLEIPGLPAAQFAGAVVAGKDAACTQGTTTSTFCDLTCVPPCPPDPPHSPRFRRGDADADGRIEITDAVRILGHLFLGNAALPCLDAADADDADGVQLTDAVRILGYLFLGTPAPLPPGVECGMDPGQDQIDCDTYNNC